MTVPSSLLCVAAPVIQMIDSKAIAANKLTIRIQRTMLGLDAPRASSVSK